MSEEQRAAAIEELEKRERDYSRLQRQRLHMDDFEPLKLIGKGAFGEVRRRWCCGCSAGAVALGSPGWRRGWLATIPWHRYFYPPLSSNSIQVRICRDSSNGKLVAVKKLKKSEMVRRGQVRAGAGCWAGLGWAGACRQLLLLMVGMPARAEHLSIPLLPPLRTRTPPHPLQVDHVKAERNVLAEVRHHSIVRLYYSFQVGARADFSGLAPDLNASVCCLRGALGLHAG